MKNAHYFIMFLSLFLGASFAFASEDSVDNLQLLDSCRSLTNSPETREKDYQQYEESRPCIYYIKGFFAAAQIVDNINAKELSEANSKPRTFIDRAYRTRLGETSKEIPEYEFLHFCVSADPEKVVVYKIAKNLSDDSKSDLETLNEEIFKFLTKSYPCKQ